MPQPSISKCAVTFIWIACTIPTQSFLAAAASEPTSDEIHIAVQEICPVSGLKLGEHGPPVKVAVGEQQQQVYLCCKGCLDKKISSTHWARIHANTASAQQLCPVMKKPLPAKPSWQIVAGRVVFVCCPPCFETITEDPDRHLNLIDGFYAASLEARKNE